MANGKASDPDEFVIRSGVRSGLKREFAFALKSQAELSSSLGRTRSRRPPSSSPSSSSATPAPLPLPKRFKKSPPPSSAEIPSVETPKTQERVVIPIDDGELAEEPVVESPIPIDEVLRGSPHVVDSPKVAARAPPPAAADVNAGSPPENSNDSSEMVNESPEFKSNISLLMH